MDDLVRVREAYYEMFGNEGPYPHGVSDATLAAALRAAVQSGRPIPNDYDWWGGLPDGAVA